MDEFLTAWLMAPGHGEMLPSLEDLLRRPGWHQDAACKGLGTARFVVGRGGGQYDAGRALSAGCPVRQECFSTALANPDLQGLWGGTSEVQRKAMRRGAVA